MRRETTRSSATDPTNRQRVSKIIPKKNAPPSLGLSTSMPFIVSTNLDQADHTTRKLIRSHVMRGRNRERGKKRGTSEVTLTPEPIQEIQEQNSEVISQSPLPPPGIFPTHMYFVDFPDEIEPQLLMVMAQVAPIVMRILFPLITSISFEADVKPWLNPAAFASDPLTLHIDAFAFQNFVDRVLRGQPKTENSPLAIRHLQKSLTLLRQTLIGDNDERRIADTTIGAVLKLATAALFYGDFKTARQHMQGLGRMVQLRGGLQALNHFPALLMEVLRCDLSITLLMNLDSIFFNQADELTLKLPSRVLKTPDTTIPPAKTTQFLSSLNEDLAKIWFATKKFCLMVNMDAETGTPLQPATIHETMTSVMYRLIHMKFSPGTPDETIRLGLLVFTHHIFLQGQNIRIHCEEFSQNYRNHIMGGMVVSVPHSVMVWLLIVGAVSLFDPSREPWLGNSLLEWTWKLGLNSWEDLQAVLMESMWIPILDGHAGAQIYNSIAAIR